jgi:hypothetical protein
LGRVIVDELPDGGGPLYVRHNQQHASSHLCVDQPLPQVAQHDKQRRACPGSFEIGAERVGDVLWCDPFLVEIGFDELRHRNDVADAVRQPWFEESRRRKQRIHCGIFCHIEIVIMRIDVELVEDGGLLGGDIVPEDIGGIAPYERARPLQHPWPQCWRQCGVVDVPDQLRKRRLLRGHERRRFLWECGFADALAVFIPRADWRPPRPA